MARIRGSAPDSGSHPAAKRAGTRARDRQPGHPESGNGSVPKKTLLEKPGSAPDSVLASRKEDPDFMENDPKKQPVMAEIERLTAEADQLPEGEQRRQLVAQIADLNVEYQTED